MSAATKRFLRFFKAEELYHQHFCMANNFSWICMNSKCSRLIIMKFVLIVIIVALGFIFALSQVNFFSTQMYPIKSTTSERNCRSDFQVVEPNSAFVYSAYIDDRPARDVDLKKTDSGAIVRIFAYYLRTIDAQRTWTCLFWYKGQDFAIKTPVISATDLNTFDRQLRYLVAMILCVLPKTPSDFALESVSLAPANTASNSSKNESNYICVVDLRHSRSNLLSNVPPQIRPDEVPSLSGSSSSQGNYGVPLQDEISISSSSKTFHYDVNYTICTSPIHGDYYKATDIVNFIEVSRIFGAQKFIFYVDKNTKPSLRNCLEAYRTRGIVELYSFTPPVLKELHYHGQIVSINECVYRTMYKTKYLINVDLDEMIVPLNARSWEAMLEKIHAGRKDAEHIAAYSFQNQFFPLQAPDYSKFSKYHLAKLYDVRYLLKTLTDNYIFPHETRSKMMARPERILIWHVHVILMENLIRSNDIIYKVTRYEALLFHYRQSQSNWKLSRELRMHEFASEIIEKITEGAKFCSSH